MKKAASQEYGQGKCVVVWAALVLTCFTVIYIYRITVHILYHVYVLSMFAFIFRSHGTRG